MQILALFPGNSRPQKSKEDLVMRNFKKISAVVVALAIMLTTLVPAFAAAYTPVNGDKALVLNQLGLYAGTSTDTFVPSLETELTRGQGAVLLAKLFNMDDAALALTDAQATAILKDFADADEVPTYAKNRLAYLVQNDIMSGSLDTATGKVYINADESLLGGQFATLLLKQLGFTVDSWKLAVDQLSDVDGAKDIAAYLSYETTALLRDHAVGIMYGSLTGKYADGSATIIEKIVEAKPELKDIATAAGLLVDATPVALDVAKVSVTDLRQVIITFNKAIDETIAEDEANYEIDDNNPYKATLSDDGKTVTLLTSDADAMDNYTAIDLVLAKELGFDADKTISITPKDTTVPSVESITATGPKTIKIILSEPLAGDEDTFDASILADALEIDDGLAAIDYDNSKMSGTTLTVAVSANLDEGDHTIKFLADSTLADNAGYKLQAVTKTFTYVKDTSPLSLTVTDSDETTVTVKFNKAIDASSFVNNENVLIAHTYNTSANQVTGTAVTNDEGDAQTFEIDFGSEKPLPPGTTNLYITYDDEDDDLIVDDYGNALGATTLAVTTTADTTKPTASVEFTDANTVEVTYSEDVLHDGTTNAANYKANYTLKNSDGDVIAIKSISYDDDDKVATLTTAEMNGGTYTLSIKNVKDISVAQNQITSVTLTFSGDDEVAPEVDSVTKLDAHTVKITFDETMNTESVLDFDKYQWAATVGSTAPTTGWKELDSDYDTIEMADSNKAVIITVDENKDGDIDSSDTFGTDNLYIKMARVKDVAGNVSALFSEDLLVSNLDYIGLDEYQVTGEKTIKMIIDDNIYNVKKTDFRYSVDGGTTWDIPASYSVSHVDGDTYITLTTDLAVTSTTGAGVEVRTASATTGDNAPYDHTASAKNAYDTNLMFNTTADDVYYDGEDITDAYAATLGETFTYTTQTGSEDADSTALKTITLTYSEDLYASSVDDEDYAVAGYDVKSIAVNGSQVTITLERLEYGDLIDGSTISVEQTGEIEDMSKNVTKAQDELTMTYEAP